MTIIKGKAFVVLDNIDTDQIIPARYMTTMDPKELAKNAMKDLDPAYGPFLNPDKSCNYTIIIARNNFGCGSSREHAPMALEAAGIKAVVANSFARIYYRNSINGGRAIYPLEIADVLTGLVKTGDEVELNLDNFKLTHLPTNKVFELKNFGALKEIIAAGGLTAYNKKLVK